MNVILYGYRYSVYSRIAWGVLAQKGVEPLWVEVDPFSGAGARPASMVHGGVPYTEVNPFGRVPTLAQDGFVLFETRAITAYVDETFEGPSLQPTDRLGRARMAQIISVLNLDAYWPLIRQVYAHRIFRPWLGEPADEREVTAGLARAAPVLAALDGLTDPFDPFLVGDTLSLADLHLGPMLACFTQVAEGLALVQRLPRLAAWWAGPAGAAFTTRQSHAFDAWVRSSLESF